MPTGRQHDLDAIALAGLQRRRRFVTVPVGEVQHLIRDTQHLARGQHVAQSYAKLGHRDIGAKLKLKLWRAKLRNGGRLVIADVIPPDVSPLTDAKALLSFAWHGGFLGSALLGLARTAFSEYRRIREEIGLAQYGEDEMIDILQDSGFEPERAPRNLGHNQARMTFVARPAQADAGMEPE